MLEAKLSKKMYTSPTVHPSDCRNKEALINDDVNVGKAETSSTTWWLVNDDGPVVTRVVNNDGSDQWVLGWRIDLE
ncbi:hypothetical protein Goshw_028532, partial [Gossypium schwendimanii]|nr:hypothetical protein [Gossypium schwendimanii]